MLTLTKVEFIATVIALFDELFIFEAAKAFEYVNEVLLEPVYELLLIDNQMESYIHLLPRWSKLLCKQCLSDGFNLGYEIGITLLQCIARLCLLKLTKLGLTQAVMLLNLLNL